MKVGGTYGMVCIFGGKLVGCEVKLGGEWALGGGRGGPVAFATANAGKKPCVSTKNQKNSASLQYINQF